MAGGSTRWIATLLLAAACGAPAAPTLAPAPPASAPTAARVDAPPPIELVESVPLETSLDHADVPDTHVVWLEMIAGARRSLALGHFYASDAPPRAAGAASPKTRLGPIVAAIEDAGRRGVAVRFLADASFAKTYPETLDRLGAAPGVSVRRFDPKPTMGGVQHAKYFVVDDVEAYLGSANFDWRALEHIHELGVRLRVPEIARELSRVFDLDWALAASESPPPAAPPASGTFPIRVADRGAVVSLAPVTSPRDWLPEGAAWDLPGIVGAIDRATRTVRVQLLTYRTKDRSGEAFTDLEDALKRAAARGVSVRLLCADWSQRKGTIEGLQSLEQVPNVDVSLVTIPQHSGGFIPFARVVHAKYLAVDGERAWIGTSNWEGDYFFKSRNVGVVVEGGATPRRLETIFDELWSGPYARRVDPAATYEAPRVAN